jgi:hypothetical protein
MYEERVIPVGEDDKGGEATGATGSSIPATTFTRLRTNFVKDVAMGNLLRSSEAETTPTSQSAAPAASPQAHMPLPPPAPLLQTGAPHSYSSPSAPSTPSMAKSTAAPTVQTMVPPTPEYMPPPPTPDLVPPPTPDLVPPPDMPLGHAAGRVVPGPANGSGALPPPPPPPPRAMSSGRIPPPPPPIPSQISDISRKRASQSIEGESVTSLTTIEKSGQAFLPPAKKSATAVAY